LVFFLFLLLIDPAIPDAERLKGTSFVSPARPGPDYPILSKGAFRLFLALVLLELFLPFGHNFRRYCRNEDPLSTCEGDLRSPHDPFLFPPLPLTPFSPSVHMTVAPETFPCFSRLPEIFCQVIENIVLIFTIPSLPL